MIVVSAHSDRDYPLLLENDVLPFCENLDRHWKFLFNNMKFLFNDPAQIVLFGDSITEGSFQVEQTGWGASLANHYMRKADVINRGFGGYNTRFAEFLLDKIFPIPSSNPPLLVTIFFGANDAAIPDAAHGIVHVPLEDYAENLHKILAHIENQSASTRIVLITPPPVDEKNLLKFAAPEDTSAVLPRRNEVTKLYAEKCTKVAKATGVPVIDLWTTCQEGPDWGDKYLSYISSFLSFVFEAGFLPQELCSPKLGFSL